MSALRLLSLDGGGIRGLSELLILREIMKRIQYQQQLQEIPLPCDYFDMIGGTSTGGLLALMLGRLRMSVNEAIEHYGILAEEVFSDLKPLALNGKFKARKLEDVIKRIVKEKTGQADELLISTDSGQCKTFVCTMAALNMSASVPHLFRTYQAPKYQTFNCTIWEAARATSAAPTFFKRITIGGPGSRQPYVDGGLGRNNPTAQVLQEAELVFPGRQVGCIVSIGTGRAQTIAIPRPSPLQQFLPIDVVTALQRIATDCESTAQDIAHLFRGKLDVYFRFNVEQGLQNVGLAQWERLPDVMAHTEQYLRMEEVDQKLGAVVLALRGKSKKPEASPTLPAMQFRPIYRTGFDVDPRTCTQAQAEELYRDLLPREPLIGYRAFVGNGSLALEFDGFSPIRWRSFLNADLVGPVRVEATVDLAGCTTIGTPSGAGLLVILPDEAHGGVCRDLFFLVEPSKLPHLHILKMAKPADQSNDWTSLHCEPLQHCSGQETVRVEVTLLDDVITVSTNSVTSDWTLRVPTSGGPKRLRAFGLCGIGPKRIAWRSFQISISEAQTTQTERPAGRQKASPIPLATMPFRPIYRTGFEIDPRVCTPKQAEELYRGLLPREPLVGYRAFVGNGSLALEFEGYSPVRWRSFLNADLVGPVRVEAIVDLAGCTTTGTPSGAGVLVILPDEEHGGVCRDFFFLVEPSHLPHLRVLKLAKPADQSDDDGWTSLHCEPLPHCSGQETVHIEVTLLDDVITVSANSVVSDWTLRVPTSGGPKRLRAFGLCGIGPRRITWTSFQISVAGEQLAHNHSEPEENPADDPELAMAILLSMQDENTHLGAGVSTTPTTVTLASPAKKESVLQGTLATSPKRKDGEGMGIATHHEERDEAELLAMGIKMSMKT